jgi:hypothetical protein
MGVPDDLYPWYLLPTGWVSGDSAAPPPGALVHIVFHSPNNNAYSKAYWALPTDLVADKEAIRAAEKTFGRQPARHY